VKLLTDPKRPVQIIFAGKAHPVDKEGKEIIRQIVQFANKYDVRRHIVFLENYDIDVARALVRGVDVWLSTPRRPMEASGTSGMKAAVNGVLNMSTFDGWWCEGYTPEVGWVIGSGESFDDSAYQDIVESQAVYNILENETIPLFYTRSADDLPRAWISRMKNSIKRMAPQFNTHRMIGEYARNFYLPATERWQYLAEESMARARQLSVWKSNMKKAWSQFAIKQVQVQITNNGDEKIALDPKQPQLRVGSQLNVKALVRLGGVDPGDVSIELYHGPLNAWGSITNGCAVRMDYKKSSDGEGEHWFAGSMSCRTSGRQGLTVRILPRHSDLVSPYEPGLILWESTETKGGLS
jgi:starch phosphorylase